MMSKVDLRSDDPSLAKDYVDKNENFEVVRVF